MLREPSGSQEKVVATTEPIDIQCKDCKHTFSFTVGEQQFYQTKGFTPPIRCPECRKERKANKENRRGGGTKGGGGSGF